MTKEELIKELELLADSCDSNYALEVNGYNRGVLDALDLVNKYFALAPVISSVCDIHKGTRCERSFPSYTDGKCRECGGQAN